LILGENTEFLGSKSQDDGEMKTNDKTNKGVTLNELGASTQGEIIQPFEISRGDHEKVDIIGM
jgi:hypothetical protein